MTAFFGSFAAVKTVLVRSIDGRLLPARRSDLIAALSTFALLWLLFVMSMVGQRPDGR